MILESLSNCQLQIGRYPPFIYDATGGGGKGIIKFKYPDGAYNVEFNIDSFRIPSINQKTTKFLGLPIPPGLEIVISVKKLAGKLNPSNGEVKLEFEADFTLTFIGSMKAPKLHIKTFLTSKSAIGKRNIYHGNGLKENGRIDLVALANVQKTGNKLLDLFLGLPNEALASLKCKLLLK